MTSFGIVLLAGGKATRVQALEDAEVFKPTLRFVQTSPYSVLQATLRTAARLAIPTCVVVDARNETAVRDHLGELPKAPKSAPRIVVEDEGEGTAPATRVGATALKLERVLTMNSDTIVPADVIAHARRATPRRAITALLTSRSVQNQGMIGVALYDHRRGPVRHWGENTKAPPPSTLSAASATGTFIFTSAGIAQLPSRTSSLEQQVIPDLVARDGVWGIVLTAALATYDYGTVQRYTALLSDSAHQRQLMTASGLDFFETNNER